MHVCVCVLYKNVYSIIIDFKPLNFIFLFCPVSRFGVFVLLKQNRIQQIEISAITNRQKFYPFKAIIVVIKGCARV